MTSSALSALYAFVNRLYVEPARLAAEPSVDVRLGHVQACMKIGAQVGLICSALESPAFGRRYGVKMMKRTGPARSEHTLLTFKILPLPIPRNPTRSDRRVSSANRRK
jgi:hypothetical protein